MSRQIFCKACAYAQGKQRFENLRKKADATRIRPSSLTNQIGERDQFYQMFTPKTNIWV